MALSIQVPGGRAIRLAHLAIDFNGTLAADGALLPGVAARLRRVARHLRVTVLTADTFGTARATFRALPVAVRVVAGGADKRRFVAGLRGSGVAAIGNGRNDVAMFDAAALAIAVIGPEGTAPELLRCASIVVRDVRDALDLLLRSGRVVGTLRP